MKINCSMKRIIISLTLVFLVLSSYAAIDKAEVAKLWESAGQSYAEGDYKKALELYTRLEKEAGISASLYYNIGNSYFKENNLAKSILYYNKALKIDPTNSDIQHNLLVANALTTNKIKEVPKFFLVRWIETVRNLLSSNGWAQISIVTFAIFLSMAVAFLLSRKASRRKHSFTIGLIAFIVTILTSIAAASQEQAQTDNTKAIVMNNAVAVKSSPDDAGKDIFVLNEGVKVTISESIGKWSKITIASGDSGWLESKNIEKY